MQETNDYFLPDGTKVSLRTLIVKEPEWARSRILVGEQSYEDFADAIEVLKKLYLEHQADSAGDDVDDCACYICDAYLRLSNQRRIK